MDILVLGGTQFVGRHIVQALVDAGHQITIFTRGQTNADLFPQATRLLGNRDSDVASIEREVRERESRGEPFDACVDVSGYTTRQLELSLDALAESVGRYLFISTVSVYKAPVEPDFTEDSPVEDVTDAYAPLSNETYGTLKVACENEVRARMGDRAVIFRLGLVNGPWDPTDRATSWSVRASRGGEIFVPAGPEVPFQIIDARDIGAAALHALSTGLSGTYNLVNEPTTWHSWLEMSRAAAGYPEASYVFADDPVWVADRAAKIKDPRPRGALPMFLPPEYGWNFWRASNARALAAGISFRPHRVTIQDTLSWRQDQEYELLAGLTREQERELIERWRG